MMDVAGIERSDVEYVAELARLALDEEEKDRFVAQLGQILDYARDLAGVDTEGVEPTVHAVPLHNVVRRDEVRPSLAKEKVLQNAPQEQDGFFRVPRILEE